MYLKVSSGADELPVDFDLSQLSNGLMQLIPFLL
jgi:hypothetical protein